VLRILQCTLQGAESRKPRSAEELYNQALAYWGEALRYLRDSLFLPYRNLQEIQNWEDEYERIKSGELDYAEFIGIETFPASSGCGKGFLSMDTVLLNLPIYGFRMSIASPYEKNLYRLRIASRYAVRMFSVPCKG
jgi:hypothetical protein